MLTLIDNELSYQEMMIDNDYDLLLAFSSDTLLVIDKSKSHVVEWILLGNDEDGYIVRASNDDEFLDAIIDIKRLIRSNIHPLTLFQ